ncbi:MAG: hypothetical protein VKO21_00710 [Candidatus Sericytochromatia bacterium]|nr:hypothetical protein [Candidatus Sericytochromatia bacterium]
MAEENALSPGQLLVRPLRDPGSRAIFLPAGTVLSERLIRRLRRASLEEACLACVGEPPWGRLPQPTVEVARRNLARRPTGGLEDVFQSASLRQADQALWTMMLVVLLGAAVAALILGDPRLLDLALGATLVLLAAVGFHFWVASKLRHRALVREQFLKEC